MGHNAVWIGGVGLVASVAAWLVCRLSGYTVAAWVAPLAIGTFCLGFSLVPRTPPGEGLEYRSYPTTCTVLTSRTVPLSPSCVVTLIGCVGSSKPCCHSAGAVKSAGRSPKHWWKTLPNRPSRGRLSAAWEASIAPIGARCWQSSAISAVCVLPLIGGRSIVFGSRDDQRSSSPVS